MLATVLPLAAAANASLLGLALVQRAWSKRARAGIYAAAFLLVAAAAITLIAIEHSGAPWPPAAGALVEGSPEVSNDQVAALFAEIIRAHPDGGSAFVAE